MNSVRVVNSKQRCGQQLLHAGSVQHCDQINQWLWPWNLKHRHCCVFCTLIDHCLRNQFSGKLFSLPRDLCCRPVQSWQRVTFYDPWPSWPISQLTRDPWLLTTPVTVTVWRLRIGRGKVVSVRSWFHTVRMVHNKFRSHQLIFLP